jgi:hypothetical protein
MNNWYIGPKKINMTVSTPVPVAINPVFGTVTAATALHLANGFYDNTGTGSLLFYIADGTVYDYNNTVIGTIPNGGAEVTIVPFGTNGVCQKKFNLFTTSGGLSSPVGLWKTVLDMNSYSLSSPIQIDGVQFGTEFGALAVGKTNAANDRYMYFLAGSGTVGNTAGQINKLIIHQDGSVSTSVPLYPNPSLGVTNLNAGGEVFSKELELSPDGKWLAWASYAQGNFGGGFPTQSRYHFVALNATGDLNVATYGTVNVYQQFNIQGANYNLNTAGFRGIEFDATSKKLFMGAGTDGIYATTIDIPFTNSFTLVNGSIGTTTTAFGFSQIELANNGNMYAASGGSGNNIGAFDPLSPSPTISLTGPSFSISNPPKDVYTLGGTNPNSTLYTLPDQIDGQDYSTIIPAAATAVLTTNTYTFGAASSQTATWTYAGSANPWNTASEAIHIIKELRIKNNSHLTINGMTFNFSPQAKVIIEQGSSLTMDGTTFTDNFISDPCFVANTWLGVEVWGHSTTPQSALQGKLIMKGGSKIEFALNKLKVCEISSGKFAVEK